MRLRADPDQGKAHAARVYSPEMRVGASRIPFIWCVVVALTLGAAFRAVRWSYVDTAVNVSAAADTRSWNNLPQYLSFTAAQLSPGPHVATVEFLDAKGQVLPTLTKTANINVSPARDTVVFVSDQSYTTKNL